MAMDCIAMYCMAMHVWLCIYGYVLYGYVFSGLCNKLEESEQLRGERDVIEFNDLKFGRRQVLGLRKVRGKQDVP